jgi:signal transduction histidine kinase
MNSALLLASVDALLDCKDLEELANSVALLAQRLIGTSQAIVILRSAEREHVSDAPSPGEELRSWASAWLESSLPERQVSSGGYRAASIDVPELALHGLIAVSCEQEDVGTSSSTAQERQQLLAAVAHLTATCSGQIVRRTLADRTLQDTRALVARGLHDLCTPLNSLRLGMHLLEPALTTKDPAIAQRTHRAVDRMAALVTNMAESIGNGGASHGQRGASVSPAAPASTRSQTSH